MPLAGLIGLAAFMTAGILDIPPARASCASAIYVDGYLQFGQSARGYDLPPGERKVVGVVPACNDGGGSEADGHTTVTRLEGVPPAVAVRDGGSVHIARGQMTALADHPLHGHTEAPDCRQGPTVSRKAVAESGYVMIGKGRSAVQIDAQTRLTS